VFTINVCAKHRSHLAAHFVIHKSPIQYDHKFFSSLFSFFFQFIYLFFFLFIAALAFCHRLRILSKLSCSANFMSLVMHYLKPLQLVICMHFNKNVTLHAFSM
jgi:hypothetical protein